MDIRIGGRLGPEPRFGDVVRQEGPALGPQRDAAADLQPLRDRTTTTARRSARSPARTEPEWWTERARRRRGGRRPMNARGRRSRTRSSATAHAARSCSAPSRRRSRSWSTSSSRIAPRRAHRDDRHRRAVPRDARDVARVRGALRRAGRASRTQQPDGRGAARATAAATRKVARARARARRRRRLDHRHPPRAGADARATRSPSSATTGAGMWKYNPLVDWTEKDVWAPDRRARPALPPAARPGLRLDRLRAVHAPGAGREGRWAGIDKTECGLHVRRRRAA